MRPGQMVSFPVVSLTSAIPRLGSAFWRSGYAAADGLWQISGGGAAARGRGCNDWISRAARYSAVSAGDNGISSHFATSKRA